MQRMSLKTLKRELFAQYVCVEQQLNLLEPTDGKRKNLRQLIEVLSTAQHYLKQVPTTEE